LAQGNFRTAEKIWGLEMNTKRDPLVIFSERCRTIASRVREKQIPFIEAVDMAWSAADFAGLIEHYGDDQIQQIMAGAFMGAKDV
jgi:hypothetical protein